MAEIVAERLARALFDSFVMYALVLGIIKLFRVKNPSIKVFLYLVAIFRPIFLLLDGYGFTYANSSPVSLIVRVLADPFNLMSTAPSEPQNTYNAIATFNADYTGKAQVVILAATAILVIYRLTKLMLFYSAFKRSPAVDTPRRAEIDRILLKLAQQAGVKEPSLLVVETSYLTPFVVGAIEPTIIISKTLAEELPASSLEVALAHEMAHIKRRDNAIRWAAIVGRGIMFFSPWTRKAYTRIELEMEEACDSGAAQFCGNNTTLVGRVLIQVAELYSSLQLQPLPLRAGVNEMAGSKKMLTSRLRKLASGGVPTAVPRLKMAAVVLGCMPLVLIHIAPTFIIYGRVFAL